MVWFLQQNCSHEVDARCARNTTWFAIQRGRLRPLLYGSPTRGRTSNLAVNSRPLYQLSYRGADRAQLRQVGSFGDSPADVRAATCYPDSSPDATPPTGAGRSEGAGGLPWRFRPTPYTSSSSGVRSMAVTLRTRRICSSTTDARGTKNTIGGLLGSRKLMIMRPKPKSQRSTTSVASKSTS